MKLDFHLNHIALYSPQKSIIRSSNSIRSRVFLFNFICNKPFSYINLEEKKRFCTFCKFIISVYYPNSFGCSFCTHVIYYNNIILFRCSPLNRKINSIQRIILKFQQVYINYLSKKKISVFIFSLFDF